MFRARLPLEADCSTTCTMDAPPDAPPGEGAPPSLPAHRTPLAGGDGADSILATLSRADGCNVLLKLLTLTDATALRGVCREAREAVAGYPWEDTSTVIKSFARWRACFPNAARVDISGFRDVTDADFAHLRGVRHVNMSG